MIRSRLTWDNSDDAFKPYREGAKVEKEKTYVVKCGQYYVKCDTDDGYELTAEYGEALRLCYTAAYCLTFELKNARIIEIDS